MSSVAWELSPSDSLSIISMTAGLFVFLAFIGSGIKIHSDSHDVRLHFPVHFGLHFIGSILILYFLLMGICLQFDKDEPVRNFGSNVIPTISFTLLFITNIWLNFTAYSFYKHDNKNDKLLYRIKSYELYLFHLITIIFIILFIILLSIFIALFVSMSVEDRESNRMYGVCSITILLLLHSIVTAYYSKLSQIMSIITAILAVICFVGLITNNEWAYYCLVYWFPFTYIMLSWILLFQMTKNEKIHAVWISVLVIAISIFDYVTDINIIIILFRSSNPIATQYGIAQLVILLIGNVFCMIFVGEFYYPGLERKEKRIARMWTIVGLGRLWHAILSWDSYKYHSMDYATKNFKVWEMLIESFPSTILQLSLLMTLEKEFGPGLFLSISITLLSIAFTVFKIVFFDHRAQEKAKRNMEDNLKLLLQDKSTKILFENISSDSSKNVFDRNTNKNNEETFSDENILKIRFTHRPFYFDVEYGDHYLNAYINNITNTNLTQIGLKEGLYIHKIGDIITDNMNFENINNFMRMQSLPFTMEFTEKKPDPPQSVKLWQIFIVFYDTKNLPFTLKKYQESQNRNAMTVLSNNNNNNNNEDIKRYQTCLQHGLKDNLYVYKINDIVVENMTFNVIQFIINQMAKKPPLKIIFSTKSPSSMKQSPYTNMMDKNEDDKCQMFEVNNDIKIIKINCKHDIDKFGLKSGHNKKNAIISEIDYDDYHMDEEKEWNSLKNLYVHSLNTKIVDNMDFDIIEQIFYNQETPIIIELQSECPKEENMKDLNEYSINNNVDSVQPAQFTTSLFKFYFLFYTFILSDLYTRVMPFLILCVFMTQLHETQNHIMYWYYVICIIILLTFEFFWYEWMLINEYKYKSNDPNDIKNYKKWKIKNILKYFWSLLFTISYHLLSTLKLSYIPKSIILNRLIQEHISRIILQSIIVIIDIALIIHNDKTQFWPFIALFILLLICNLIALKSIVPELKKYQDIKPIKSLEQKLKKIFVGPQDKQRAKEQRKKKNRIRSRRIKAIKRGSKDDEDNKNKVDYKMQPLPNAKLPNIGDNVMYSAISSQSQIQFVDINGNPIELQPNVQYIDINGNPVKELNQVFQPKNEQQSTPLISSWICTQCTFNNTNGQTTCVQCENAAPNTIKCKQCTLWNLDTLKTCAVCNAVLVKLEDNNDMKIEEEEEEESDSNNIEQSYVDEDNKDELKESEDRIKITVRRNMDIEKMKMMPSINNYTDNKEIIEKFIFNQQEMTKSYNEMLELQQKYNNSNMQLCALMMQLASNNNNNSENNIRKNNISLYEWLKTMELQKYLHLFMDNGYHTIEEISVLNKDRLLNEIGITNIEDVNKILDAIKNNQNA